MNKNLGFTLAEVLITLGIIGVIASLTAPALVKNSGQAKIGPSLAKFVNTWETACEQMIQEENASKLSGVASGNQFMEKLSEHIIMVKLDSSSASNYKVNPPNKNGTVFTNKQDDIYQLKDGSIVQFWFKYTGMAPGSAWEAKHSYKGNYAFVMYDMNGLGGKNVAGREVFLFGIDETGILVPYQSNAYKALEALDYDNGEKCDMSSDNVWDGFACTGTIADSGWKADY